MSLKRAQRRWRKTWVELGSISWIGGGRRRRKWCVILTTNHAKKNWQVMGNKWEKERLTREGTLNQMPVTWTSIFCAKEVKKEKRYKMFIDLQREKMEFVRERLILEKNIAELERQEKVAKWELEQTVTMHGLELEKERLRPAREMGESRIMLQDINLFDEEGR